MSPDLKRNPARGQAQWPQAADPDELTRLDSLGLGPELARQAPWATIIAVLP
jgi:hypothetical protein